MWTSLVFSLLYLQSVIVAQDSRCYRLNGNGRNMVVFENQEDISVRFRYKLTFNTLRANELLYYVEGTYTEHKPHDYESLFISNGILHFFAFNPAPYGAGQSFGSHVQTNFTVNNGTWVEVEFFRNYERQIEVNGHEVNQTVTGMSVGGHDFVVTGTRTSMDLTKYLWLGGHPDMNRLSTRLTTFDGEIKDFYDLNRNREFNNELDSSIFNREAICIDI
ncbi:uncharacterized protein LOC132547192 [Ylistrum balloti]|uniref:uncharacterized protein LOC132547192 n=1 Tax=Ylistrum balloti TaxID=509963 RepID=UPI002905E107|nr:uncharacterized protein LOC132547192 [Ylistrum balloti]